MKKAIICSFSGGRTSAYMSMLMKEQYKDSEDELIFIFANTGKEREETLDFVNWCDKTFKLNLVWVEANVHHNERKSTSHNIVDYKTASRNGEPFKEIIKKYGISNQAFPHCTRELKQNPIASYIKSLGFSKKDYKTAIGIRIDESRRMGAKKEIIYPLYEESIKTGLAINNIFIRNFWSNQCFGLGVYIPKYLFTQDIIFYKDDNWKNGYYYKKPTANNLLDTDTHYFIELKEHEGNCDFCWKKSLRKKLTLIKEQPHITDWYVNIEKEFSEDKYYFHRNNNSTEKLIEESQKPFNMFTDDFVRNADMDDEKPCNCRTVINEGDDIED